MSDDNGLSRRKMLALTLSGAVAGVAGCSEDGKEDTAPGESDSTTTPGGSDSTTDGVDEGQMADSTPDTAIDFLPQDANWNRFSSGPNDGRLFMQPLAYHYWNNTSDWFVLKEDGYTYDSDTLTETYELKDTYYWWNGDQVTGEDFWLQSEIERLFNPEASGYEEWTLEDEFTVKSKRKEKVNPILLGQGTGDIADYRGWSREWYEKLADATTQDERDQIVQNLSNTEITTEQLVNDGLGCTAYKLTDWDTQKFVFERFDEHPRADDCPFPGIRHHVTKDTAMNQAISNDKFDYDFGMLPKELKGAAPDHLETIFRKRDINSRNILFNYKNSKHIARRNVRRALVTVLDWDHLRNFWMGEGGFVKQIQSGIPRTLENKWLGDDLTSQLYKYPIKSDEEQANAFMEQAGYTKEGGTWIDEDGDPLNFRLLIGAFGTQEALGKAMTQSWQQWGAEAALISNSNQNWISKTRSADGWDISIWAHGYHNLSPINFYGYDSHWHMRLGSKTEIEQWLDEGKTHSEINGRPLTPTIPSEPGALEVGGSGKQINIKELIDELAIVQSEERSREIIQALARYWNYDLPAFDMFPQESAMWGDTKDFSWPKDADEYYIEQVIADNQVWYSGVVDPVSKS